MIKKNNKKIRKNNFLRISCVVIGLNSSKTIFDCLKSIKNSNYKGDIEIIYVDGGSTDNSVDLAKRINGVKVVQLKQENPTPGRQRNAGWKIAKGNYVHFFDGDIVVKKNWIKEAVRAINEKNKILAVCGIRREKFPNKNWYHFITDLEWDNDIGEVEYSGAEILVKRSIIKEVGGYDANIIAGEDPLFSFRIRQKGYKIKRLNKIMGYH
ncbi:MAG: glycosyltransferase, partial [Fusobacteriaceae bacterium]|nr:glycosyltransferase [Fusobacteriaceae bacterium]